MSFGNILNLTAFLVKNARAEKVIHEENSIVKSWKNFSSFISTRQSVYLQRSYLNSRDKLIDIKEKMDIEGINFQKTIEKKSNIAHQLLKEEMVWKEKVRVAEKKKSEAISFFTAQFMLYKYQLGQASSISVGLDESDISSLEEKKRCLEKAKMKMFEATKVVESVSQKPIQLDVLVKLFQDAKNRQMLASSQFHKTKASFASVKKEMEKAQSAVQKISASQQMDSSFWFAFASRVCSNVGNSFSVFMNQKKSIS